jgi:hypothetical protein
MVLKLVLKISFFHDRLKLIFKDIVLSRLVKSDCWRALNHSRLVLTEMVVSGLEVHKASTSPNFLLQGKK